MSQIVKVEMISRDLECNSEAKLRGCSKFFKLDILESNSTLWLRNKSNREIRKHHFKSFYLLEGFFVIPPARTSECIICLINSGTSQLAVPGQVYGFV